VITLKKKIWSADRNFQSEILRRRKNKWEFSVMVTR